MVQTILRRPDVEKATGLRRSAIYDLIGEGKFPKPIRLSRQSVGWLETEIADWQRARIAERDGRRLPSHMEEAA
ncbi:helix-turn-helix transcriptional regulator [Aureimonas psammosilenae]|uniref:helix-turn-helix transcriptional regulator n=1 Tax=Aureimonas psammosilenae TaxID=2495496 RepID=UPI0012608504|nr:AlpA family phage regulatory protein [Aureimonas psammosilenae]